jgi:hypothetical protein
LKSKKRQSAIPDILGFAISYCVDNSCDHPCLLVKQASTGQL